jgi:hypothetical protein
MKALIWVACVFLFNLLIVLIKDTGIILGGIPTVLIYGLMFFVAHRLCKAWDIKHPKTNKTEKGKKEDNGEN